MVDTNDPNLPAGAPIITAPAIVVAPPLIEPVNERAENPLSPTTTSEQDRQAISHEVESSRASLASEAEGERRTEGQRHINLIWETTQAKIALVIVYSVIFVASFLSLTAMLPWATEKQVAMAITAFMLLSSLSTLVIGFYYGRTNHQRTGGVGGEASGQTR